MQVKSTGLGGSSTTYWGPVSVSVRGEDAASVSVTWLGGKCLLNCQRKSKNLICTNVSDSVLSSRGSMGAHGCTP